MQNIVRNMFRELFIDDLRFKQGGELYIVRQSDMTMTEFTEVTDLLIEELKERLNDCFK